MKKSFFLLFIFICLCLHSTLAASLNKHSYVTSEVQDLSKSYPFVTYEDQDQWMVFEIIDDEKKTCQLDQLGDNENVVVPSKIYYGDTCYTVIAVGYGAGKGLVKLTSLTLPATIRKIGEVAFYECNNLKSVKIGENVTEIGDGAFLDCPNLTSITWGKMLKSIGNGTFANTGISHLVIPSTVTTIGAGAFEECRNLESVILGESLVTIGDSAFYGLSNLSGDLVIPDSVTTIGESAFSGCKNITSIKLGKSLTSIEFYAFEDCTGLTGDLTIQDNVTTIGPGAFLYCENLTSLHLGNSVKTIERSAFEGCKALSGELRIPDSVISIGYSAFMNCENFTSIYLGNSIQSIGECAFMVCSNLRGDLVIPNSVTYLGERAFATCGNLDGILEISSSVTSIEWGTFLNCKKLKGQLKIPEGITRIDNNAFYGCAGFTGELVIPNSVTSIGESAFNECSGFTSLTLPSDITAIESRTFYGCTGITSLIVPNVVTSIGEYAFFGCYDMRSVELGSGLESLGEMAFAQCYGITSLTSQATEPPVCGISAFGRLNKYNCSLTVPEASVEKYKKVYQWNAFFKSNLFPYEYQGKTLYYFVIDETSGLCELYEDQYETGDIVIPSVVNNEGREYTVTSIGDNAFSEFWYLTSIIIPSTVKSIGAHAFWDCIRLSSIVIPNSVTSIGACAFGFCSNLKSAVIGSSVKTIGENAFLSTPLISLTSRALVPPHLAEDVFYNVDTNNCRLFVPASSYEEYRNADQWKEFFHTVAISLDTFTFTFAGQTLTYVVNDPESHTCSVYLNPNVSGKVEIPSVAEKDGVDFAVVGIAANAFDGCGNLTSVKIPDTVDFIGNNAFNRCRKLNLVICNAIEPPHCSESEFEGVDMDVCVLNVPAESYYKYISVAPWMYFRHVNVASGMESPLYDSDYIDWTLPYEVYSLSGKKLAKPYCHLSSGVYIILQGSKIAKIIK